MKFRYKDLVKATSGFYEGTAGFVIQLNEKYGRYSYLVSFGRPDPAVWFNEDELELVFRDAAHRFSKSGKGEL